MIVSGLPASGKTTVARQLAPVLGLPLFDKDDILEALFDTMGSVDRAARQHLSRASDHILRALVTQSCGAVLTSFWRHPGDTGSAGTPCGWLGKISASIVEVHCLCAPEVAVQRFLRRSRHPGHHDAGRSEATLLTQFQHGAERGSLGVGRPVIVDTSAPLDVRPLIREITDAFEN